MPRIRSVKPEFWDDEGVGALHPCARLLFICMWNLADDHGRLRGSTRLLHLRAFPYDDITDDDAAAWIDQLVAQDMVRPYESNGQRYYWVRNWEKHQKIPPSKRLEPQHPEPPVAVISGTYKRKGSPKAATVQPESSHGAAQCATGRKEGTGNREQGTGKDPLPDKAPPSPDPVRIVFNHWAATRPRPGAAKLTTDRRSKVKARLRDGYTAAELCNAVDGMMATPHNCGDNDRGERYDDLTVACQSGANVDRFIANADKPPTPRGGRQPRAFPEPVKAAEPEGDNGEVPEWKRQFAIDAIADRGQAWIDGQRDEGGDRWWERYGFEEEPGASP